MYWSAYWFRDSLLCDSPTIVTEAFTFLQNLQSSFSLRLNLRRESHILPYKFLRVPVLSHGDQFAAERDVRASWQITCSAIDYKAVEKHQALVEEANADPREACERHVWRIGEAYERIYGGNSGVLLQDGGFRYSIKPAQKCAPPQKYPMASS